MKITNHQIFQLHADFCKVLSNSKRLIIIALLSKKDLCVGDIAKASDTPLPTVSQHLRRLRELHIVNTKKKGQVVVYSLADPDLMKACVMIRRVLLKSMRQRGMIAQGIDPEGVSLSD
ncbi:MAG: winged helix-turn-helix transcriptional regulator [Acidobacteria bacterium]|nr:winged helix-turn-helix transcriptional regulator [Acidobacteriota bacterium]